MNGEYGESRYKTRAWAHKITERREISDRILIFNDQVGLLFRAVVRGGNRRAKLSSLLEVFVGLYNACAQHLKKEDREKFNLFFTDIYNNGIGETKGFYKNVLNYAYDFMEALRRCGLHDLASYKLKEKYSYLKSI